MRKNVRFIRMGSGRMAHITDDAWGTVQSGSIPYCCLHRPKQVLSDDLKGAEVVCELCLKKAAKLGVDVMTLKANAPGCIRIPELREQICGEYPAVAERTKQYELMRRAHQTPLPARAAVMVKQLSLHLEDPVTAAAVGAADNA